MRPARLAALAAAVAAAGLPAPAPADEPPVLVVEVGQSKPLGGSDGRCDDLAVVSMTLGPQAVVTGQKPGSTTCSYAFQGGARRVVTVKVIPPPPPPDPAPASPPAGKRDAPAPEEPAPTRGRSGG
jgi:hypothetical protein